MDLAYLWKKALGSLTPEEEQAYRAQQAAQQAQALRAQPVVAPQAQPVTEPTAVAPGYAPQVQPGTALRARSDTLDSAMAELRRQQGLPPR